MSLFLTYMFVLNFHHPWSTMEWKPTGCMDNEPEPSRGVPCKAFPGGPTNSGSTIPRTAHLDGGAKCKMH